MEKKSREVIAASIGAMRSLVIDMTEALGTEMIMVFSK